MDSKLILNKPNDNTTNASDKSTSGTPFWTREEDELLLDRLEFGLNYEEISRDHLKHRSATACRVRFNATLERGFRRPLYEDPTADFEEEEPITGHSSAPTSSEANAPATDSLSTAAEPDMGNLPPSGPRAWTRREDAMLLKLHRQGETLKQVGKSIPRRSAESCCVRLSRLLRNTDTGEGSKTVDQDVGTKSHPAEKT